MIPALLSVPAISQASDLCDRLRFRLNQMPEVIGSGASLQYKAETVFRLNRLEISIRRDLRKLQCPTASIVEWGADNADACSELGAQLAEVRSEKQKLSTLRSVVSQAVDDGSGLLPAIKREMRRANCSYRGSPEDTEIIGHVSEELPLRQLAATSTEIDTGEATVFSDSDDQGELSALFGAPVEGSDSGSTRYGMIDVSPRDAEAFSSVTAPELQGEDFSVEPETARPEYQTFNTSPSSEILTSTPGRGEPTVPTWNRDGSWHVTVAVVSVRP